MVAPTPRIGPAPAAAGVGLGLLVLLPPPRRTPGELRHRKDGGVVFGPAVLRLRLAPLPGVEGGGRRSRHGRLAPRSDRERSGCLSGGVDAGTDPRLGCSPQGVGPEHGGPLPAAHGVGPPRPATESLFNCRGPPLGVGGDGARRLFLAGRRRPRTVGDRRRRRSRRIVGGQGGVPAPRSAARPGHRARRSEEHDGDPPPHTPGCGRPRHDLLGVPTVGLRRGTAAVGADRRDGRRRPRPPVRRPTRSGDTAGAGRSCRSLHGLCRPSRDLLARPERRRSGREGALKGGGRPRHQPGLCARGGRADSNGPGRSRPPVREGLRRHPPRALPVARVGTVGLGTDAPADGDRRRGRRDPAVCDPVATVADRPLEQLLGPPPDPVGLVDPNVGAAEHPAGQIPPLLGAAVGARSAGRGLVVVPLAPAFSARGDHSSRRRHHPLGCRLCVGVCRASPPPNGVTVAGTTGCGRPGDRLRELGRDDFPGRRRRRGGADFAARPTTFPTTRPRPCGGQPNWRAPIGSS